MPAEQMTLEEFFERLEVLQGVGSSSAAIGVTDAEVARYARVLEFGSIAGQRPWPRPGARTVLAVDPETGAQVVVSASAPNGFIRVRAAEFLNRLRDELDQPKNWLDAAEVATHLASAVERTTEVVLEELRRAAPRDSRRLAKSLAVVSG